MVQVLVQLAGTPGRIEAFLQLLKPLGIIEVHRSGVIAMARRYFLHMILFQLIDDIIVWFSTSVSDLLGDVSLEGATTSLLQQQEDETDISRLPPG